MLEDQPKTFDSKQTVALPDILPNQPIVWSQPQAWNSITVEQHCQPPFEIPEHSLPQHLIAIQVGPPIKVENVVNGRFQSGYSVSGDLSVLPAYLPNWERWYGTIRDRLRKLHICQEGAGKGDKSSLETSFRSDFTTPKS